MAKISDLIIKLIVDSAEANAGIKETQTRLEQLAEKANDLSKGTSAASKEAAQTAKEANKEFVDGFREAQDQMSKTGSFLTKWVTGPLAALGTGAVVAAKEFESAFAGVKKTVDATDAEFEQLSASIKEMSMELPFSAAGIAEVTEAAGQLGIETPYIMDFTRVMVDLGVATNLSADQAATSLARFVNIMGTSHTEYSNMGSAIVELGNNFATTESEIVNMSMRLAGAGKQVGMSEAEIFGLSAALTSMGLTAEAGGTAMTKWMTTMQVAGTEGSQKMRELQEATGLTARELEMMQSNNGKRFKELADSLDLTTQEMGRTVKAGRDLEKMADVMGVSVDEAATIMKEDAAGALALFFDGLAAGNAEGTTTIEILNEMGINEVRLRDALLKSGSAHELINEALAMGNKAYLENTALTKEAAERYETLDSRLTMLKNTINVVFINLGEQMIPLIKELTEWLQGIAEGIAKMDPDRFQAIVKLFVKLAALGPSLKIASKAVGGIADAVEKAAKKKAALETLYKSQMFKNKKVEIPEAFIDGGWDATKAFDMGVQSSNKSSVYTSYGVANKEYIKMLERMNSIQKESIAKQYESITAMDKMKIRLQTTAGSMKEFGQSTQAAGIFTGGLITYFVHATATNEDVRRGLVGIIEVIVDLGKYVLDLLGPVGRAISGMIEWTAVNLGFKIGLADVAVVLGGLFMTLTNSNPIFLAVSATVVAITKGLEVLGANLRANDEEAAAMARTMDAIDDVFANSTSSAEMLALQAMPELTKSFEAMDSLLGQEGFLDVEGNLEKLMEDFGAYTKSTLESYDAYSAERLKAVENWAVGETSVEMGTRMKLKEIIDTSHKEATDEFNRHKDAVLEIDERLSSGRSEDREKDLEDLRYHLGEMEKASNEYLLGQIKNEELTYLNRAAAMSEHFLKEEELTDKQIETLKEMQTGFIQDEIEATTQKHIDLQKELERAKNEGKIEEKEYQTQMNNLRRDYAREELNIVIRNGNETVKAITGFNDQELKSYWENKEKIEGLKLELAETSDFVRQEEINAEIKRLEELEKNDDKLRKIHKGYEEYLKTLPDEYHDYFHSISGEMNFQSAMDRLNGYANKTRTYGEAAAQGYASGMRSKIAEVERAAVDMGLASNVILQEYLVVNSPSRLFMGLGNSVSEGFAKGIDDMAYLAEDATLGMGEAVAATDFDVPALSSDFKTRHIKENVIEQTYTMSTFVGNAVAEALKKTQIKAVLGEDDFEDGVNDVIYREMRRG